MGVANAYSSAPAGVAEAFDGSNCLRVTSKAEGEAGVNAKPRWVFSAVAGLTNTAGAWVRTDAAGKVTLLIRELRADGSARGLLVAERYGLCRGLDSVDDAVYPARSRELTFLHRLGHDDGANQWLEADLLSLTAPQ